MREEVKSVEFTVHTISFVLLKSVLSRVCPINKNLPLVFFPVVCNIRWVYFIHIMHFWCLVIFKMSFKEGQLLECGTWFFMTLLEVFLCQKQVTELLTTCIGLYSARIWIFLNNREQRSLKYCELRLFFQR